MTESQPTPKNMEQVTFPKTGPANKSGVQLLFEDDEVKIMRWDNRLIRCWKDDRTSEYVYLDDNDSIIPDFIEWQTAMDITGLELTLDQIEDILFNRPAIA